MITTGMWVKPANDFIESFRGPRADYYMERLRRMRGIVTAPANYDGCVLVRWDEADEGDDGLNATMWHRDNLQPLPHPERGSR